MSTYPIKSYKFDDSANLDNILNFHKKQLYNFFNEYNPQTLSQYNTVIETTNEIVEQFKEDIEKLVFDDVKWEWVAKLRLTQDAIFKKSKAKIDKSYLE